jgi:hypothetical protein
MKKHLLIAAGLFTSAFSFSQFTQGDEPAIGDGTTLYVIDSMAPSYDNVTGSSVEWDYSSYGGYNGESRNLTVLDPSATTNASDYPSATAALDIQGFLVNYTSSTATERTGHGFVYTDGDIGDVVVVFDTDEAIQYQYPFSLGDNFTDAFEGTATYNVGTPQTSAAAGELTATVDGEGTLKLANGNDFTNVQRYKIADSTVISNVPLIGNVTLKRTQYEYYDLANGSLPIFVFTHVEMAELGTEFSLVMSSIEPTESAGIEENVLSNALVYPNPASDVVNIYLSNELMNTEVSIVDAMGRVVLNQSIENDFVSLDVAHLEEGIYFLKISNGDIVETKTVVIK